MKKNGRENFKIKCYKKHRDALMSEYYNNICCSCKKEIKEDDFAIGYGYWEPRPFQCHKWCKDKHEKKITIECQIIDADCNDCKYFKRESNKPEKDEGDKRFPFPSLEGFPGNCLKHSVKVYAHSNYAQGYKCFKHRKL